MKSPVKVAITGAAGKISYYTIFRIAAGDMFGKDQPVVFQLLEVPTEMNQLKGVVMELIDCAFELVHDVYICDDPNVAFNEADYALLIGSAPRVSGMERSDLLKVNGRIFIDHGKALNDYASRSVKVLVVGNPANTNALIASKNAPDLKISQFTAMTRLDHNRARSQIAQKLHVSVNLIKQIAIWGNHSGTQYPDVSYTKVGGQSVEGMIDHTWLTDTFIPTVQQRGAEIIQARGGISSVASAGCAVVDHMRDWVLGTPNDDWVSMAIPSDGSYDIETGLICSFPVTCKLGHYKIVPELKISEFSRQRIKITEAELKKEKEFVKDLLNDSRE